MPFKPQWTLSIELAIEIYNTTLLHLILEQIFIVLILELELLFLEILNTS